MLPWNLSAIYCLLKHCLHLAHIKSFVHYIPLKHCGYGACLEPFGKCIHLKYLNYRTTLKSLIHSWLLYDIVFAWLSYFPKLSFTDFLYQSCHLLLLLLLVLCKHFTNWWDWTCPTKCYVLTWIALNLPYCLHLAHRKLTTIF